MVGWSREVTLNVTLRTISQYGRDLARVIWVSEGQA